MKCYFAVRNKVYQNIELYLLRYSSILSPRSRPCLAVLAHGEIPTHELSQRRKIYQLDGYLLFPVYSPNFRVGCAAATQKA